MATLKSFHHLVRIHLVVYIFPIANQRRFEKFNLRVNIQTGRKGKMVHFYIRMGVRVRESGELKIIYAAGT